MTTARTTRKIALSWTLPRSVLVAATLAAGACAEPEATEDPDAPRSTSSARFDLGDGDALAFASVPFPSELYRDATGRIALGAWPNPQSDTPLFDAVRDLAAGHAGFCGTCNVTFAIDGELDAASIPASALPGASASLDDAIAIVDLESGTAIPLRVQWDASASLLSVRPARGHVMMPGHPHVAILTSDVRGADGLPLAAAPDLAAILDGHPEGARATAAAGVLEPALQALDALDLDRDRIAGLAVFTPEDPTADLLAARAAIHASPLPSASVDAIWSGAALDELLGTPVDDRPGIDVPPADGTDGTASVAHTTTAFAIAGRFAAPRFVDGEGTDVGATPRDAAGRPTWSVLDDVPFLLLVPEGVDLARLPVVVSHHGFNASRTTGFVLADTVGRAGFAVLAIDAFQHGARAASAQDVGNAMRGGIPGSDGFPETTTLDVSARVFGLSGSPPGMALHPAYPLAAFLQFAADAMAAVRFVREGDLSELRAADPAIADLAFDPDRIAFVGNSMGAVVGTAVAVAEPDVDAFVLDVMPGSIVETLAESGEFRPLSELLLLPRIGVEEPFDEVQRAMLFDPTVDLWRWILQPIDPLALSPHLVRARVVDGPVPDLLVQLAGHDEVAAPAASESVVAAAGIPAHGAFAFAAVEPVALPVTTNLDGATVAAVRMDGAMHGMLEVSQQTSSWQAPLVPPLSRRDVPIAVDNPIAAVHAQIEGFTSSVLGQGHATIAE